MRDCRCWSASPPRSGSIRRRVESRPTCPSLTSAPVVDTEAPFSRSSAAPAPIEASPVRALFDPSAVLSSMKASFPSRVNARGQAGDLPARELDRAVAESAHCRSRLPRCRIPRCPRSRRGAPGWRWSRSRCDRARIIERRRRHLVRRRERGVADGESRRCWSAPPPRSGSIRRRRRWRRDRWFRH